MCSTQIKLPASYLDSFDFLTSADAQKYNNVIVTLKRVILDYNFQYTKMSGFKM